MENLNFNPSPEEDEGSVNNNLNREGVKKQKYLPNNEYLAKINKREEREKDLAYLRELEVELNSGNDTEPNSENNNNRLDKIRAQLSDLLLKYPDPADTEMKELNSQIRREIDKRKKEQEREKDLVYLRGLEVELNSNNDTEPNSENYNNRLDEIRAQLSDLLLKYPDPADTEMKELNSQIRREIDKRKKEQERKKDVLNQELQQQFNQIKSLIPKDYNDSFYGGDIDRDRDSYFRHIAFRINEDIKELKGFVLGRVFNRKKIKELENLYNILCDDQNGYIKKYYRLQQQIIKLEKIN